MRRFLFLLGQRAYDNSALLSSQLLNEEAFYDVFLHDIRRARRSVIIESPFITTKRLLLLHYPLKRARKRGVHIVINTRDPDTHRGSMRQQARDGVAWLQHLGVTVIYTGNLHRKLAIIDHRILYEGSLNILSQSDSCEMMRRTDSAELVRQMIRFTNLRKWYKIANHE
jgi:phosphatidylserine/phosphatidylglycerophosphate/cardiolipin synthase-like enzyme